jgi:hypothetical protein
LKRSQNAFFGDFSSFRPFFSINRYGESNDTDTDVFVDYFENVDDYSENIDDHHFEETVYDSIEIDDATEINVDYTEIVYESVHIENIDQSSEDYSDDDQIYDKIIDAHASLVGSVHRW